MIGLEPMISRLSVECIHQLCYTRILPKVIFTRDLRSKPCLTYFPRCPCATRGFSGLNAHDQREHRAITFSSPPLGFHSVRIRCTTYEALSAKKIHLVARLVLRHDTYSYLAYQPNQAPSVFVRLAKRTFDSTRLFGGRTHWCR